jgi:hypothetical protein
MLLFLLLFAILASPTAIPAPSVSPHSAGSLPPISPDELYSRRALRRARLLIQMRVMEMREGRLECIREALRHQLPSALWQELPSPSRGTPDARSAAEKCEQAGPF